jgi:trk system potassium uptake protein
MITAAIIKEWGLAAVSINIARINNNSPDLPVVPIAFVRIPCYFPSMKVIICGAGQVGYNIAQYLSHEDNEITIIDQAPDLIQRINDTLDVRAIQGHASYPDVLEQAGAANADMLIAVTQSDEVNMVAAQVAHSIFQVPTKIARIRAQNYLQPHWAELFSHKHMPIDVIISPEKEVAHAISDSLHVPGAFDVIPLAGNRVAAVGVLCGPACPVINTPLRQLASLFPQLHITIVAIVRDGRPFIPSGTDQILAGDQVYFIGETKQMKRIMSAFGHEEPEARKIIIAGGGNIGYFLGTDLNRDFRDIKVKFIEWNRERARFLAVNLPDAAVFHGDALDREVLQEVNISRAETYVAVTNDDEVNILSALLAKRYGCRKVVALVNSSSYEPLISTLGIDTVINPRTITVSRILQHVRRGRIFSVHSLGETFGEIIEAEALESCAFVGRPISELDLPEDTLVGAIIRKDDVVFPRGNAMVYAGDRIIIFAPSHEVRKIEKMLCVRPDYF